MTAPIPISALNYKAVHPPFEMWNSDLYMGKPSIESDRAWNDLLGGKN